MLSKELSDYIKLLSKRDTKTLTQKTLKTTEELGELAKKVLPYEGAFATNHRIVTKNNILEEVSDTLLCLLSIAYDIGTSDEELESMVTRKASVWAEKQEAEIGLAYPLPFEIHVTVRIQESNEICQKLQIENFKSSCLDIGVKSIVIELQNNEGESIMQDIMTSSKHFGDNTSAMAEVDRIVKKLQHHCFDVVRAKIETVPWHPAAPRRGKSNIMPADCYFECHFAVFIDETKDNSALNQIASYNGMHKSRNIFKKNDNGTSTVMLTSRQYDGTYEDFQEKIELAKKTFADNGFDIEKVIVEFSVYTSYISTKRYPRIRQWDETLFLLFINLHLFCNII